MDYLQRAQGASEIEICRLIDDVKEDFRRGNINRVQRNYYIARLTCMIGKG